MEQSTTTPEFTPFLLVDGIPAGQTPYIERPFKAILPLFDQIIEIGFDRAGLSLWLYKNKKQTASLHCYDISFGAKQVDNSNIHFRQGNCFDPTIINEIANLIQLPGRTLVLADGGSKEAEFKVYAPYLKTNDVIMLHDYAHTDEDFNNNKEKTKWIAGPESRYQNILPTIQSQGLTGFHYNTFKEVFWGSFVKMPATFKAGDPIVIPTLDTLDSSSQIPTIPTLA